MEHRRVPPAFSANFEHEGGRGGDSGNIFFLPSKDSLYNLHRFYGHLGFYFWALKGLSIIW